MVTEDEKRNLARELYGRAWAELSDIQKERVYEFAIASRTADHLLSIAHGLSVWNEQWLNNIVRGHPIL